MSNAPPPPTTKDALPPAAIPFPTSSPPDHSDDNGADASPAPLPDRRRPLYHTNSHAPFAKSAAKRQSVMGLPSIQYLQHGFVKLGLTGTATATRPPPGSTIASMLEDLEDGGEPTSTAGKSGTSKPTPLRLPREIMRVQQLSEVDLPPSPAKPEVDRRMPWERQGVAGRNSKDEKQLRTEMLSALEGVCEKWGLVTHPLLSRRPSRGASASTFSTASISSIDDPLRLSTSSPPPSFDRPFSPFSTTSSSLTSPSEPTTPSSELPPPPTPLILDLLQTTTSAIRSVQAYVVSLPNDAFVSSSSFSPTPTPPAFTDSFAATSTLSTNGGRGRASLDVPTLLSAPSTSSRRASSPALGSSTLAPLTTPPLDPLVQLRKASLEVLGALKDLEHRYRLPSEEAPAEEEQEEGEEIHQKESEATSYRTDVLLEDLLPSTESEIVRKWVELVDGVVLQRKKGSGGGGTRRRSSVLPSRRGSSIGGGGGEMGEVPIVEVEREVQEGEPGLVDEEVEEEEESEEEDLPEWASEGGSRDGLDRAHALLWAVLPSPLSVRLPPRPLPDGDDDTSLIDALSDGYLLCHGHNAVLRLTSRPFGFIPLVDIFDLSSSLPTSTTTSSSGTTTPAPLLPLPSLVKGNESLSTTMKVGVEDGGGLPKVESVAMGRSKSEQERNKVGDTFRRAKNWVVFAAALKLRHLLTLPPPDNSFAFDTKTIARREEGTEWREMVRQAVSKWSEAVAKDVREG